MWAKGLPDRLQWLTTATDPDLMLWLVDRMKHGKLTLLQQETEILPGVRAIPAHDTHTAGSQYVTVENERDGRWLLAGDNCYVYESFTGTDGDGAVRPDRARLREHGALHADDGGDVAVRRRRRRPDRAVPRAGAVGTVPDASVRRHPARGRAVARARRAEPHPDRETSSLNMCQPLRSRSVVVVLGHAAATSPLHAPEPASARRGMRGAR